MRAFLTGITGQDGAYLSEYLINKGYEVHGTVRRSSSVNTERIDHMIAKYSNEDKLKLHYSDLLDSSSLTNLINKIQPDEIYNLGAQSHVSVSFSNPILTTQIGTIGSIALLEAVKNADKKMKFYQASSSEMFGGGSREILNENSHFDPKSPYGASKVFAHDLTKIYRESYNLFAVNGILFNHESPLRGETFVTRKISKAVGRIHVGIQEKLTLGNLDASRDWGYAKDYIEAMWMMMQFSTAEDWVIATGITKTVKDFVKEAFDYVNLDWEDYVLTSEKYMRPNEVEYLLGDATKAKEKLNWQPKVNFEELIKIMVEHDINEAKKDLALLKDNLISPTWEYPKKV